MLTAGLRLITVPSKEILVTLGFCSERSTILRLERGRGLISPCEQPHQFRRSVQAAGSTKRTVLIQDTLKEFPCNHVKLPAPKSNPI